MDNLRRLAPSPIFQYKGQIVQALLYYKGNSDLVHSWDLVMSGFNLSKMSVEELHGLGFTEDDLDTLNARVLSYVEHKEGRR